MERTEGIHDSDGGPTEDICYCQTKKEAIRTARRRATEIAGSRGKYLHAYNYVDHTVVIKCPGCGTDTIKIISIMDTKHHFGKAECVVCRWCGKDSTQE